MRDGFDCKRIDNGEQTADMNDLPPVALALQKMGIPYRLFRHSGEIHSIEQAAQERGQQPQQVVRSILFHLGEDQFAMVLVAGPQQLSWPKLRRHFGQSRLTMATNDEVIDVTGYQIGTVGPLGLRRVVRLLVDESVTCHKEISFGSGERGVGIIMQSEDLMCALGIFEPGSFTKE